MQEILHNSHNRKFSVTLSSAHTSQKWCSCKSSNTENQTHLWRERDRHPERQTAKRAKSSKGYRARKTDPDGEREQRDSSRSAKHQSRAEMKEFIWCGNEPGHRVQRHLCRLSLTCPNVTHTHEKIQPSDERWQIAFTPLLSIILIITELGWTLGVQ